MDTERKSELMERFVKEIIQNLEDDTGIEKDKITEILNRWELFKIEFFTKEKL